MRHYLDGHIGELILACVFILSLVAFTMVYLIKGVESQLLGGVSLAALSSLATYMQKRGTTNVGNIEQVTTSEQEPKV